MEKDMNKDKKQYKETYATVKELVKFLSNRGFDIDDFEPDIDFSLSDILQEETSDKLYGEVSISDDDKGYSVLMQVDGSKITEIEIERLDEDIAGMSYPLVSLTQGYNILEIKKLFSSKKKFEEFFQDLMKEQEEILEKNSEALETTEIDYGIRLKGDVVTEIVARCGDGYVVILNDFEVDGNPRFAIQGRLRAIQNFLIDVLEHVSSNEDREIVEDLIRSGVYIVFSPVMEREDNKVGIMYFPKYYFRLKTSNVDFSKKLLLPK